MTFDEWWSHAEPQLRAIGLLQQPQGHRIRDVAKGAWDKAVMETCMAQEPPPGCRPELSDIADAQAEADRHIALFAQQVEVYSATLRQPHRCGGTEVELRISRTPRPVWLQASEEMAAWRCTTCGEVVTAAAT